MANEEIVAKLQEAFTDAEVDISGDGSHFNVLIISDDFEGLRSVKKQQLVYAVLNDDIASGAMHAVNMSLFTKAEWQARQ